jgi:IS30 family transposase
MESQKVGEFIIYILDFLFYLQNTRYCDNGTEFKGAFQKLADSMIIPIIRGRSYHPQTQGSVEKANQVFKDRLQAI